MANAKLKGFKIVKYSGRTYYVILHDEKKLLVVESNEQTDSEGFYKCAWMIYEGCRIFGVVQSKEYIIRFNPMNKEILMDESKEAS